MKRKAKQRLQWIESLRKANNEIILWNEELKPFCEKFNRIQGFYDAKATVDEPQPNLIQVWVKSTFKDRDIESQIQMKMHKKYGLGMSEMWSGSNPKRPETYIFLLNSKAWKEEFQELLDLAKELSIKRRY